MLKEIIAGERKYRILDVIGRGASCIAYSAECEANGLVTRCILKEYAPKDSSESDIGKKRFIDSGKRHNQIRQYECLNNQTPPVSCIFEANGTAYIDVSCYNGTTLDKLCDLTLSEYMKICRTVANTIGYYHRMGFICLDIKPENIFVMQNSPDDTITQMVEFIDFDSVRDADTVIPQGISYTKAWASPEQLSLCSAITKETDIFTLGEMVFYILFGRHSSEKEHRSYSGYPFDECEKYEKYLSRPDVQSMFSELFRNTIRSSAQNRFHDMKKVTDLLDRIIEEIDKKTFFVPVYPTVPSCFVGREKELDDITEYLKKSSVLFINGVGGIGKSTLVRKYFLDNRNSYDVMLYIEYDGDIRRTIADDRQICISTLSRYSDECTDDYYERKLRCIKDLCSGKKTLLIIDDYTDKVTKELSRIISLGYDTIIVTRNSIPHNSYPVMSVGKIGDRSELIRLVSENVGRPLSPKDEQVFDEIIELTEGHTLLIELIARQISAENMTASRALELIKQKGFTGYSDDCIGNIKDGEEVYATIGGILSELFSTEKLSTGEMVLLKTLSLFGVRGFETSLICDIVKYVNYVGLSLLDSRGWIYLSDRVRVHPVVAETVRSMKWPVIPDKDIMDIYGSVTDIYVGLEDCTQIKKVLEDMKKYVREHKSHYCIARYYDDLGKYYDTALSGAYTGRNEREQMLVDRNFETINKALYHMSKVKGADRELLKLYFSQAGFLIRCYPNEKELIQSVFAKARQLLEKDDSENICYYCTTKAWYYTNCERNSEKCEDYMKKGLVKAQKYFSTGLELIDIIYIPWANCRYYLDDLEGSIAKLREAADICDKYPDALSYVDKKAALLSYMLDVYNYCNDIEMCRKTIAEIDIINDRYESRGIYRRVSQNIRDKVQ